MLSEATFDQLLELPGVGPTRTQQFLQLMEEAGGGRKCYRVLASQHWGVDWEGLADSGKNVCDGADMGWLGKKGIL